jgi:hypothetical protein
MASRSRRFTVTTEPFLSPRFADGVAGDDALAGAWENTKSMSMRLK